MSTERMSAISVVDVGEEHTDLGGLSREELEAIVRGLLGRHHEVLRSLSHDIRNPLQIIVLQAERLQKIVADPASREMRAAESILAAARQLRDLIQNLTEMGRSRAAGGG